MLRCAVLLDKAPCVGRLCLAGRGGQLQADDGAQRRADGAQRALRGAEQAGQGGPLGVGDADGPDARGDLQHIILQRLVREAHHLQHAVQQPDKAVVPPAQYPMTERPCMPPSITRRPAVQTTDTVTGYQSASRCPVGWAENVTYRWVAALN